MARATLLTGCASGIGKAMANALYHRGDRLVLTDVNANGLETAANELNLVDRSRVDLVPFDVRDADAWERVIHGAIERYGQLDVVMNIAGYLVPVWAKDATRDAVDRTIDVNVKGLMFGTNAAVRAMIRQGSGHVVNIASMAALVAVPGLAIYSASKHAARAYSIAVAQEVRRYGVFVTAVCPTVVATPMMDVQIDKEEAAYTFSSGRALTADEVATAVVTTVLSKKPLEFTIPAPGTNQAALAKLANAFPEIGLAVGDRVRRLGRAYQSKLKNA